MVSDHCLGRHNKSGETPLGKKLFVPNLTAKSFHTILQDDWNKYCERLKKRFASLPSSIGMFNLGYGCIVNNLVSAVDLLFKREYPSIYDNTQEKAVFIPENFLCRSVACIEEEFTEEQMVERLSLDAKEKDGSSAFVPDDALEGDKAERNVYVQLLNLFNNTDKYDTSDILVLHGHDIEVTSGKKSRQQEMDIVIVSPKRRLFVIVEIKSRYDFENKNRKDRIRKALQQLQKCVDIMQNYFSDILDENWTFLKSIYIHNFIIGDDLLCQECSPWVISKDSSFDAWWENIESQCPVVPPVNQHIARDQFCRWFRLFVFLLHKNPGAVTTSMISEHIFEDITKKVGTPENILFWTANQRDLLNNSSYLRVMFMSSFGTGKTLLMCEKAKQLARLGYNSTFILWTSGSAVQTLLNIDLQNRFSTKSYKERIKFATSKQIMNELGYRDVNFLSNHLLEYLNLNKDHHIFVDEWYWAERNDDIRDFVECLKAASDRCLWITWHRDTISSWTNEDHAGLKLACEEEGFVVPSLSHSMRNTKTVIETAKRHGGNEAKDIAVPSHCFPEGIEKSNIYLNDGKDEDEVRDAFIAAINAARLRTKGGILVVTNTEPIGGLTEKEFDNAVECLKDICAQLSEPFAVYCLHDRYQGSNFGNVENFIVNQAGVLFTDHRAIEGYEAQTVICYAGREQQTGHMSTSNFVMRCVVNCIIIQQPESVIKSREFVWDDYIVRFKRNNRDVKNREMSFDTWPSDALQIQGGLIKAGFYYMGVDDLVKCCSCGGKRSAKKDFAVGDPVLLHLQYYPNCDFARSIQTE